MINSSLSWIKKKKKKRMAQLKETEVSGIKFRMSLCGQRYRLHKQRGFFFFFPIELTVSTKPREALRKICKEKSFEPQKMNHTVLKSKGVEDQGGKSQIQQKNSPRIPTHTKSYVNILFSFLLAKR